MENRNVIENGIDLHNVYKHGNILKFLSFILSADPHLNDIVNYQAAEDGSTVLHWTLRSTKFCNKLRLHVVQTLLKQGANECISDREGKNALHVAAELGKEHVVRIFLERGAADINARTKLGLTPLHLAVENDQLNVVIILLESKKALINTQDAAGNTPLHFAAGITVYKLTESLLLHKADVKCRNSEGKTALHVAAETGNEYVVVSLLERGADINAQTKLGLTPLHLAVKHNRHAVTDKLLESEEAAINPRDLAGDTPLHYLSHADEMTYYDFQKSLLLQKADVNCRNNAGETALHVACRFGFEGTVRLLLDGTSEIDARTKDGSTPLHYACLNEHTPAAAAIFRLLVKFGADVDAKDNEGETALRIAARQKDGVCEIGGHMLMYEHDLETRYRLCLQLLDEGQMDIDARLCSQTKWTALYLAVELRDKALFDLLISRKPKPTLHVPICSGETPLLLAVRRNDLYMARVLLRSYVNPNDRDGGGSALMSTVLWNYYEKNVDLRMMKLLLDYNADCNKSNVLHKTVSLGVLDLVRLLIEKGADVNAREVAHIGTGRSAFERAVHQGLLKIMQYLLLNGVDSRDFLRNFKGYLYDMPHDIIVIQHLALLNSQDLVDEGCAEVVSNHDHLSETYEACRAEMELMRSTELCDESVMTYRDLLTKNRNAVVRCLRCEGIRLTLEKADEADSYRKRFPMYADRIKLSYEEGLRRLTLLEDFTTLLQRVAGVSFPRELACKIGELVGNFDLARFIENIVKD